MKTTQRIRNLILLSGLAAVSTGVTACIITTDGDVDDDSSGSDEETGNAGDPCRSGSHNILVIDDGKLACQCLEGFNWCSSSGQDCCPENGTGTETGTGTSSNTGTGSDTTDDNIPESCTPEQEGASICTNTDKANPQNGRLYMCEAGKFVRKDLAYMDERCRDPLTGDGDFALGCWDTGARVEFICEFGPGTPCADTDPDKCSDDKAKLFFCVHGRLASEQCTPTDGQTCKVEHDNGDIEEFETGECGEQDGAISCLCFDPDPNEDTDTTGTTDTTATDDTSSETSSTTGFVRSPAKAHFRRRN